MKKYEYKTVTLGYAPSKRVLAKNLQETPDENPADGLRLVKFDYSDRLGACVVVFERMPNSK